jgi:hypothetical protein
MSGIVVFGIVCAVKDKGDKKTKTKTETNKKTKTKTKARPNKDKRNKDKFDRALTMEPGN